MSVKLQKGQKVSLSKEQPGLSKIVVGLGWDEVKTPGQQDIDCDAIAILLGTGYTSTNRDVVFYNNLTHASQAVRHMGDNLTGGGDGDDEQIVIDLNSVPSYFDKIVIAVTIYQAAQRRQHFGMIENAFIRLVNSTNNKEICIYNLTENYSGSTAMIFGEVYKQDGEWKFNAVGQGTSDNSVVDVARRYGINWPQQTTTTTSSSSSSGGCYVATAVYGSYDCPQVWTLRRYRDNTLAETWYGRAFIRTYYAISPTLVKWFGHTEWFKNMWKGKLDRMVADLNSKGVQDTPYQDRDWN